MPSGRISTEQRYSGWLVRLSLTWPRCTSTVLTRDSTRLRRWRAICWLPMMLAAVQCFMAVMKARSSLSCSFQMPSLAEARAVTYISLTGV